MKFACFTAALLAVFIQNEVVQAVQLTHFDNFDEMSDAALAQYEQQLEDEYSELGNEIGKQAAPKNIILNHMLSDLEEGGKAAKDEKKADKKETKKDDKKEAKKDDKKAEKADDKKAEKADDKKDAKKDVKKSEKAEEAGEY